MIQGQILCASSVQITLLTGAVGQPEGKLYLLCAIYFIASFVWWILYRRIPTIYVLTVPFLLFGLAFFLLGVSPAASSDLAKGWIYNVAGGIYTFGSAAGCLFFALNFGTEGKHRRSLMLLGQS
jgi:alpha-1,3-glucan synthase